MGGGLAGLGVGCGGNRSYDVVLGAKACGGEGCLRGQV